MSREAAPSDALASIKKIQEEQYLSESLSDALENISEALVSDASIIIDTGSAQELTFENGGYYIQNATAVTIPANSNIQMDTGIVSLVVPEGYYVQFKNIGNAQGFIIDTLLHAGLHENVTLNAVNTQLSDKNVIKYLNVARLTVHKLAEVSIRINHAEDAEAIAEAYAAKYSDPEGEPEE